MIVVSDTSPVLALAAIGQLDLLRLLFTDVIMPEVNGRALARHQLSIPLYPHLRRLFMPGFTADVIARDGVLDEAVHFVQKSFSTGALAAKMRETLEARQ